MLDQQMCYLVASRRWLQDYDLGDIDIYGRSHYDLFPNLATHWRTIHKSCLRGEVQSCEEEPFPRADGSLDWLRWEMHPWYDKTHIGGIIMFSEIITQRKQAEAELQRTNEQLQASVEKLEQNNREITLLGQLSEILQACLHLEEAYQAIESFLPPLFPYCSGSVYILNRENYLADAIATWGTYVGSEAVFYPNDCWALRQWHPHFTNHSQDQLLCNHMHSEQVAESLCVPMTAQGKALGLLHLNAAQYGTLTEDRQQFAVTVSEHMSLALANLTLRETLQRQSIRDGLTGLYNRRYLEEALEREIHRARRKTQSVGILMVDIDHFKRFNDNFGHEVGDAVLQEVGKLLMQNIRPGDIACRYGGEEMTLILPDADVTVAKQRAEKIRKAIKQLRLEYHPPQLGSITVSLGIACFPTHGNSGSAIIQVADAALYTAKAQGRDRAVVARTRGSA
jgi:diguanylate cyclase (GGDEF)-like protein